MKRLSLILVSLFTASAPLVAQEPVVRGDAPMVAIESLNSDLKPFLTLRTPDAMLLFTSTALSDWLATEMKRSDAALAAGPRALFRRSLVEAGADPFVLASEVPLELAIDPSVPAVPIISAQSDTVSYLPLPVLAQDTLDRDMLPGALSQYADLGIQVSGDGQLGGSWSRYKPCDIAQNLQCETSLFPQLRPDMTFGVRVAGKVADRVNVNVNFDQRNEFDAENNLNVSYQGLPDEILQTIDVGDVSISMPASRYLTRGIPAGNFGLRATAQIGPLSLQTVFAQQKGDLARREFKIAGAGSTQSVAQQQQLVIDDANYVQGQFFFLVDPTRILGYPHIDALALRAADAPDDVRPRTGGVIELYRDERLLAGSGAGNTELGRFLADAVPSDGGLKHSGTFRRLTPGVDYVVHASGLWLTLKSPLRPDEALAMAYVTERGDTVGQLNAEQSPPGTIPLLQLLRGPVSVHQPGSATWLFEMHNVYRLDSSAGVELNSIDMIISLGERTGGKTFQTVAGQQLPYLRFFGLDEDAPSERIDEAQIYQPSRGTFGDASTTIPGTFIVFPTLQPFLDPAAVPSRNLTAAALKVELGTNANSAIYNEVDPVNRAAATRFKLNFDYRVKSDGLASSFSLGAFGIRENSEKITLGGVQLQRGVDYEIDYDVGQLTLRDPGTLFATHPGAELGAVWEQKPLFQIAPTSVFGLNARYSLGSRGQIDLVGLYQAEKSVMARPQLGTEAGSIMLGGISGSIDLGGALLDRVFGALPGIRLGTASSARLTGEIALSAPDPNTQGEAYVEDFEATDELLIDPRRQNWVLGSRPEVTTGDLNTLPFATNTTNAAPLIWTHDFLAEDGGVGGAFKPSERIDRTIIVAGTEASDYGMYLNFADSNIPPVDARRWRSITTSLSPTGTDMSRSEYLEFYAASSNVEPLALIFDIGTVSEDAFYVDSLGRTTGTYPDGTPWGIGTLDEEARLANREVWGPEKDALGLWNQECLTQPRVFYVTNDPRLNCTRGNGIRNSEDMDGNGVLSRNDGAYFRYVVQLDQLSQYIVRSSAETRTPYQLYRIPLRSGTPINGANESTWRFIKQLRMTVAGEPSRQRLIQLARMRIVGSRWTKRDLTGVNRGLLSDAPGMGTSSTVRVGAVSALIDPDYRLPIDINVDVQNPNTTLGGNGAEVNEKSLRIAYEGLAPNDRAEVYYRYAQQARSFMNYRSMRLWALPRKGDWGRPDGERLVVKVGSDARNYYLFQTTLHDRVAADSVLNSDWLPEVVIDFEEWFKLKAESELRLIERPTTMGGQDTVWSADSAYALVLEDRARAPNLQQIRELSFAVYNGGALSADGEVWINDVRLTGGTRDAGRATALSLNLNAGEFIDGSISFAQQDDVFQQLNENASYIAAGDLTLNANAHLDRLLPSGWGIDLPLSVSHSRTGQDPTFLQNTDIVAAELGALRETGSGATRVGVRLSKRTPTANPLLSLLVDGTALRFGYSTASNRQITSRFETGSMDAGLSYAHPVASKSLDVIPMFMERALRSLLPTRMEGSDAFKRLVNSRLRFTPANVTFNTGYNDQIARSTHYNTILESSEDTLIRPIESPRRGMQNDIGVALQPFTGLSAAIGLSSVRDLLAADRATEDARVRAAIENARTSLGGVDVGWETNRNLNTTINYDPVIATWLRLGYTYSNLYLTDRNPSYISTGDVSDSLSTMQRRFETGRVDTRRIHFGPSAAITAAFGVAPKNQTGLRKFARAVGSRFDGIDLNWRSTLSSQFERESILPGIAYQLGLGDFQSFRVIESDTAARALETSEFSTTAAFVLTRAMRLDVRYRTTDQFGVDLRGGQRAQNERQWPSVKFTMRDMQLPESWRKYIANLNFEAGIDRVLSGKLYGSDAQQERITKRYDVPVSTTISLPKGMHLTYSGKYTIGEDREPTGRRETLNGFHRLAATTVFPAPTFLSPKLTQPLQTSLSFTQTSTNQCGTSTLLGSAECTRQIESTTRQGRFQMDTGIQDMRLGLSLDYNSRQNHIGTQTGTSQFMLSLFGQFSLKAGKDMTEFGGIR